MLPFQPGAYIIQMMAQIEFLLELVCLQISLLIPTKQNNATNYIFFPIETSLPFWQISNQYYKIHVPHPII